MDWKKNVNWGCLVGNTDILPDGYMVNPHGHLIPVAQVREMDKARDELVLEKVAKVKSAQKQLVALKDELMNDIAAFVQLSAERYDAKIGGNKGNVTLLTYDGKYKLSRSISETLSFDEGLQAAKALIDECLREWTANSPTALKALVEQAFHMDNEGRINTNAVLALRRLEITDDRWQRAMLAVSESLRVIDSKSYVRVYERDSNGKYEPISLDFASL